MSYNPQYPAFVAGRCKDGDHIKNSLTPGQAHLTHMIFGISGEMGELIQAVHNDEDLNIKEEVGDFYFYLQGIANEAHMDWTPGVASGHMSIHTLERIAIFTGDVVDVLKKHIIYQKPMDLIALRSAMGRLDGEIGSVVRHFGFTPQQCISDNVEKLTKRYHSGRYSDQQAQERADK